MIIYKIEKLVVFMIIYLLWLRWSKHANAQVDHLKPGDTLNISSPLYSKQGKYLLTFTYVLGSYENTQLCILSSANVQNNLVWLYDRNHPIYSDSSVLSLSHSGVLKIESKIGKPMIIYSSPQPINNTVATMLDTGNFVLEQLHPNGTKTLLWQTFDYPINTLIPNMKLGINRKTGHNWSLVSPITRSVWASGEFSLVWEPIEGELNIKKRGKVYWKSGKLRSDGLFENIPTNVQQMYRYIIVSNTDEDSFAFETKDRNYTRFPEWVLFPAGRLINNVGDIGNADMCYGYNSDGGCQKWENIPTCREPGYVFEKKSAIASLNNATYEDSALYVYNDCKESCWRNCNCTAFTKYYNNGTGCIFYSGNFTKDLGFGSEINFHALVKPTKVAHHVNAGKKKWIWISAITAAILFIICPFILCLGIKRKKYESKEKKTKMQDLVASNESYSIKDLEDDFKGHDINIFNYASISEATMDFSSENKLGQGGYGPVYKGILPTGQEIAVKRLSKNSGQGIVEFKNELVLISELQHTNLVQLIGCCIHEEERILIYEYMPNKSLDFYLFDSTKRKLLDWKKRLNIIEVDTCLQNMQWKEFVQPSRIFIALECCYLKLFAEGKIIVSMILIRPLNLVGHAWELWNDGDYLELIDPLLNDSFVGDEVKRCIHVGLLCVEQNANDRPTMSDVISMLTNKYELVTLPRKPAFYVRRDSFEGETTSKVTNTDTYSMTAISSLSVVEEKI
ncbi:unnamed protein product [Lathyrus sativus]|nr:unnamed protein product [Lathyrus sativus]